MKGTEITNLFEGDFQSVIVIPIERMRFYCFMVGDNPTLNAKQLVGRFRPFIVLFLSDFTLRNSGLQSSVPAKGRETGFGQGIFPESDLTSRMFNVLEYSDIQIMQFVYQMFSSFDVVFSLRTDPARFAYLLKKLQNGYNPLGFHNWLHAVDCCQFVYSCLQRGRFRRYFTPVQLSALLLASLSSDIGHEGRDALSHLPFLMGNKSTLEKYHAKVAYDIIQEVLPDLTEEFWNMFMECMLATDMDRHDEIIGEFEGISGNFQLGNNAHRLSFAKFLVKCGNIAYLVRSFEVVQYFANGLAKEVGGRTELWNVEIELIDRIGMPMLQLLGRFCGDLMDWSVQMEDNRKQWREFGIEREKATNPQPPESSP
jgi:hypothetical protein